MLINREAKIVLTAQSTIFPVEKWSEGLLTYQRTKRPCGLKRTDKEPRHAERTVSGFACIHNRLQQKVWKAMFMFGLLLEERMHAFL